MLLYVVGLIITSAVFGIATSTTKLVGEPIRLFFVSLTEIIMQIIKWFIWLVVIQKQNSP